MTTATDEILASLQRLHDIEAARTFAYGYAGVLNMPDASTVSALFGDEGELITPGGSYVGAEAIAGFFTAAFTRDPSVKRHFICNTRVMGVENRRVSLSSEFFYVGRGERSVIGWGGYDDIVDVASPEPWFVSKTITIGVVSTLDKGWAL